MKIGEEQLIQDKVRDLRENTDFISAIFQNLTGYAIIAADFDGNIIAYNNGAHQIYGYTPEEIIGKQNIEIFFPEDLIVSGKLQHIIVDLMAKGQFSYEGEKVRRNGATFPAQVLFTLTTNKNGNVVGFVEMVEDLTQRKRAERQLLIAETAIETCGSAVATADLNGNLAYVTPAFLKLRDCDSPQQVLGSSFARLCTEESQVQTIVQAVLTGKGIKAAGLVGKKKDGTEFIAGLRASLISDADGEASGITFSLADITENKRVAEAPVGSASKGAKEN